MERLNSIMSQQGRKQIRHTESFDSIMKIESSRIVERMAAEDPQSKITHIYIKSSKKHD